MNLHLVLRQLGSLILVLSVTLIAIFVGAYLLGHEPVGTALSSHRYLLVTASISTLIGVVFILIGKQKQTSNSMGRREALLLGSSSYIVGSFIAALPFWLWAKESASEGHPFQSTVNCLFEATSGLTTTGATILADISLLPAPLLFWRALLQWLGGLGIIVLFVAVLPMLGSGGRKLFRVEGASAPGQSGVKPSIKETARVLWVLYVCLTAILVMCYWFAGMPWFDAVCHSFSTLATGGFSTHSSSIGSFNSHFIDIIAIVFIIIAATNFGLYFAALQGRLRTIWEDPEFRCYIALLVIGSIIVTVSLMGSGQPLVTTTGIATPPTAGEAITQSVFTVVSQQTGTGFCVSNFDTWPFVAKAVIVFLMFVGGCSGSTACGVKVIRIWIAIKVLLDQLERAFRPHVVRPLKIGKSSLDDGVKLAAISYVLGLFIIFTFGATALMILESGNPNCDITTAATASLSSVCTVGPGLAKVGALENFNWFSDASKILMCLLMTIGRLEIFAVLVLFSPRFWRST